MASDIRISRILNILLIVLLSLKLCENRKLELTLNTKRAMHHLSPYFLSISLDPSILVDESTGEFSEDRFDFVKAVNMAKGLSPAFLRVGGPSTDNKMYSFEAFPFECVDDNSSSNNSSENCNIDRKQKQHVTFTGTQLMLLSHFAEEAGLNIVLCLGYDLNKQEKHDRKATQDIFGYKVEKQDNWDAWDSKQALDIIRFADSMEISLGYQMGYEVDYLKAANRLRSQLDESDEPAESQTNEGEKDLLDGKIAEEEALRAGAALSRDIIRLRILLDAFPRSRGSLLLSPGICLPTALSGHRTQLSANSHQLESHASRKLSAFLHAFLKTSEKALTAVVWHPSSFSEEWNEHGAISTVRNSDAAFHEKDSLSKILGCAMTNKPIWTGESWNDKTKTTSTSKNEEFEDALVWAQRLGVAARMGTQVILHSPTPNELQYPNHQYWVSLLHKKLAGVVVLDTHLSGGDGAKKDVQFFAHCTPHSIESWTSSVDKFPHGSFMVYAVNPTNNSVETYLRVVSGSRNLFHEGPHKELTTATIYEYSLTAERDDEYSQNCTGRTLLNGKLLEVDENGVLPHLIPNTIQININRGRKVVKRAIKRNLYSKNIISESGKEKFIHKRTIRGISGNSELGLTLSVPPKSVTFWVLPPSMGVKPCLGEEDKAEEEGMQFGATYYHTPKLTGETYQEDNDKEEGEENRERQMTHKLNKVNDAHVNNQDRSKRQMGFFSHLKSNVEVPPRGHILKRKNSFGIRGKNSLRKGSGTKMLMDSYEEEDKIVKNHLKKKRKDKKPTEPKVLAFNVGTEDENESLDAFQKGMIFLSDDIASSSKEHDDYENESDEDQGYYVEDSFGEDEVTIFESNVYQRRIMETDPESVFHVEDDQIVSSEKMLVEPQSKEDSYEDYSLGEGYYHGPGDYFMEYRKLAEMGRNNEESSRELFEAEFATSTADDEEIKAKILIEDTHHGKGSDRIDEIYPSKSPEKYSLTEQEVDDVKQNEKEDASLSKTYDVGNSTSDKETSPEQEDSKMTSDYELAKELKDTDTECKEEAGECAKKEAEEGMKDEEENEKDEEENEKEEEGEILNGSSKIGDKDFKELIVGHKKYSDSEKEALLIALAGEDASETGEDKGYYYNSVDDSESVKKNKRQSSDKGSQWISNGKPDPNPPLSPSLWEMKGLSRKRRENENNSHSSGSGSISKDDYQPPYIKKGDSSRYAVDAPLMGYGSLEMGGRVLSKRNCREGRIEQKNDESIPKSKLRDKRGEVEEGISESLARKDRLERDISVSDTSYSESSYGEENNSEPVEQKDRLERDISTSEIPSSKSSYSDEGHFESAAPKDRLEQDIIVPDMSSSESSYNDGDNSESHDSHRYQSEESTEDFSDDYEEQEKLNMSNSSSGKTSEDEYKNEDEEKHYLSDRKSSGDFNRGDGGVLAELGHESEGVHRLTRDPENKEVGSIPGTAERVKFFFNPISQQLSSSQDEEDKEKKTEDIEGEMGTFHNVNDRIQYNLNPISQQLASAQDGDAKEKETEDVDGELGTFHNVNDRIQYNLNPISKQLASAQDGDAGGGNGSDAEKLSQEDLVDITAKTPDEKIAIGDPQSNADSNPPDTAQGKYSLELSLIESRRLDRRRMEAERRRQMEASRRQAAEARRRAMEDLRQRVEENRQRLLSGLNCNVGDVMVHDESSSSSVENMRKTFDDLRNALRARRELRKVRSPVEKPPENSNKTNNKDGQQDFVKNSCYEGSHTGLVHRSSAETKSSAEEWPVDKHLTNSPGYGGDDFIELLAGGRVDKVETNHDPARPCPYFSIDTAKEYRPRLYGILAKMFSLIPPYKHAKEMEEISKSLNDDKKQYSRFEYEVSEQVRNKEENEEKRKGHNMENPNPKYEKLSKSYSNTRVIERMDHEPIRENHQVDYKKNAWERNKRQIETGRKIPKIKERKTRMIHSYSYEVKRLADENGVLANKILKFEKDLINDKENTHFFFIGDNKDELKKEHKVDRDEIKMHDVDKYKQMNRGSAHKAGKNLSMSEEDSGSNQNISQNKKDVTNDSVPEINEGEIKDGSNSFISVIMKRISDFLQIINKMMSGLNEESLKIT